MKIIRKALRRLLQPFGLHHAAERWYWRMSPWWLSNVELVPRARFRAALDDAIARMLEQVPREHFGDYLEFGVYNGVSMSVAHQALVAAGLDQSRLIGFDSFAGMPSDPGADDGGVFKAGQLYFDEAGARANLKRAGVNMERVVLVKGWYDQTLTTDTLRKLKIRNTSLVMVDCVIYSSTAIVLQFLEKVIHQQAVVIFDDWTTHGMAENNQGQRRALSEFLAAHQEYQAEPIGDYEPNARIFLVTRQHAEEPLGDIQQAPWTPELLSAEPRLNA